METENLNDSLERATMTDFYFKEDLEEAMENNPDVKFKDDELKGEFEKIKFGTLLEVEKEISSAIIILSFKEVTEELLQSAFNEE